MKFRLFAAAIFLAAAARAEVPVIPRPSEVVESAGTFALTKDAGVRFEGDADRALLLAAVNDGGVPFAENAGGKIVFVFQKAAGGRSPEAYTLDVTAGGVRITGDTTGLLYGARTLAQMIAGAKSGDGAPVGFVHIDDTPRFAWRGYMLDVSRSFTTEKDVLKLIDAMSRYKLNRLHLHLTDTQGWRIEIKKYPKLTDIGSRGDIRDARPDAPRRFYTQDQIRNIVAYAKTRGIVVVPEIDMPGHANAANRAYPENDGEADSQTGKQGYRGGFTLNPAKPETLKFLDDILAEVAGLFPDAGVIHMGGDEVGSAWKHWAKLPDVKALMAKENLEGPAIEPWFNRRMASTINKLGFTAGGWDEIAGRGLKKDGTLVFWWRHDKPRVMRDALAAGYPVVLCPRRPMYFDFVQSSKHRTGRRWGGFNPLADVYDFPAALKLTPEQEKHVVGLQACLWTETCGSLARREFLTWPRLVAVAESGWTPAARKDYASFETRLKPELDVLKSHGFTVYDPFADSAEVRDPKGGAKQEYLDKPE